MDKFPEGKEAFAPTQAFGIESRKPLLPCFVYSVTITPYYYAIANLFGASWPRWSEPLRPWRRDRVSPLPDPIVALTWRQFVGITPCDDSDVYYSTPAYYSYDSSRRGICLRHDT
jgi:hypothetical protein